jgi:hypothetical protein
LTVAHITFLSLVLILPTQIAITDFNGDGVEETSLEMNGELGLEKI